MIFPSYMRVHVPGSPPFHPLTLPSSRALCRSGKLPQRTYRGFLDRLRSCISLDRDPDLQAQGLQVPRSARTMWKILRTEGLILASPAARHQPLPPREPLEEVQMDFKDVTTVPADPDGKRQHVVETCNFVDAGTSILLEAQVRDDFRAETAFDAVVAFLRRYGLPPCSPSTVIRAGWEARVGEIFLQPCVACCSVWGWNLMSARHSNHRKTPLWSAFIGPTNMNACSCIGLGRGILPSK
jgi:hypothetical protein